MRSSSWPVALLLLLACGPAEREAEADPSALAVLTDLDPDPAVVHVSLVAREVELDLGGPARSPAWVYADGATAATPDRLASPVLVAKPGDLVIVDFENQLSRSATTIHWHGIRLDSAMDGAGNHEGDEIFPGESFQYRFVAKDAGTFWYHPHVRSDEQIERGLYGAVVVRDDGNEPAHSERVLILDDVDLDTQGALVIEPSDDDLMAGRHGSTILVNGLVEPRLPAITGDIERWRIVNASNGRYFELAAPGLTFRVVESDGGALPEARVAETLRIAPGERFTVDVDLSPSLASDISVVTLPVDTGHGSFDAEPRVLFTLEPTEGSPRIPAPMAAVRFDAIAAEGSAIAREVELLEVEDASVGSIFLIGNEAWPFNTPWTGSAGAVELWRIENLTVGAHPFHVHGMFFQVLDDAGKPRPDVGWKDTIDVPSGEAVTIALELERGHWMFHCQIPEHAERGMMGEIHVAP